MLLLIWKGDKFSFLLINYGPVSTISNYRIWKKPFLKKTKKDFNYGFKINARLTFIMFSQLCFISCLSLLLRYIIWIILLAKISHLNILILFMFIHIIYLMLISTFLDFCFYKVVNMSYWIVWLAKVLCFCQLCA